jgi:two-component system response regulator HydG
MRGGLLAENALSDRTEHAVRVIAVGPDPLTFRDFGRFARAEGARFVRAPDSDDALRALRGGAWHILILPIGVEGNGDLDKWAGWLHEFSRPPRVIGLAQTPALALRSVPIPRFEVLPVPVRREQVSDLLRRVREVEEERVLLLPEVEPAASADDLISQSPAMLPVFRAIAKTAPTDATTLIVGESGTGKELVARAIHRHSARAGRPFVTLDCAAVPESLLESELFGHETGAVTGAMSPKIGRIERASGGTLFLDGIGDMSLLLQAKVLRAVEEREIERVGGGEAIGVDVRLIAAVNRDPIELIREGRFREDLYFRLSVVTIQVPRLVERGDDLLLLVGHYLREFGERYGKRFSGLSEGAWQRLRGRDWPGNVGELRNTIERAVLAAEDSVLRAENLPGDWTAQPEPIVPAPESSMTLQEVELAHIRAVLAQTRGRVGDAARVLGVHRNTLSRKLRLYGP